MVRSRQPTGSASESLRALSFWSMVATGKIHANLTTMTSTVISRA